MEKNTKTYSEDNSSDDDLQDRTTSVSSNSKKQQSDKIGKFDAHNARFPLSIVWTPLPGISWLLPFIGHTGICDA